MNRPITLRVLTGNRDPHLLLDLSLAQLQRMADKFDLGRIVQMDKPFSTQCNLTDPFRTGQGTFILRARHGEEYGDRVNFLHKAMQYLRSRGFPAPESLPTTDGCAWTLWGNRLVEVQRFIPHDVGIHRDWNRMNAAASTLGDLHRLLRELPHKNQFVPPEMRNDLTPTECMGLSDSVLENIRNDSEAEESEAAAADAAIEQVNMLAAPLAANYERIVGNLPWTVVHGDFHPWNLLYTGDVVAGVVDFDFLQERERLFDVAYALRNLVVHMEFPPGNGNGGYETLPWWKMKLWLDLYDESSYEVLSHEERNAIPKLLLRLQLVDVIAAGLQENPVRAILSAARGLPVYEWLADKNSLFI